MEDTQILDWLQCNLTIEFLKELEFSELSLRELVIEKINYEQNNF